MREGTCPCGAVTYAVRGPVRDIVVCCCDACRRATGGPWAASAAHRQDLAVAGDAFLTWETASASEHDAARGRCRRCGTVVFWDAPGRETVSFAASTLADRRDLRIAAHIWCGTGNEEHAVYPAGLPHAVAVRWRA